MTRPCTRTALGLVLSLTLGACGSLPSLPSIWPFGEDKSADRPRIPPGATEYTCDNGRRLYVRFVDNGKSAWVILPEREFRLTPVISASGARYSNGVATLDTRGDEATLADGATVTHANCKTGAKPAAG